jgi:hypothetical protein
MKAYQGIETAGQAGVWVIDVGERRELRRIMRHSTKLEHWQWGFDGAAPADLALSILTEEVGAELAERHHMRYMRQVVARLPRRGFEISARSVREWVEFQERAECGAREAG